MHMYMYMYMHRYICICICVRKARDFENRIRFQFLCSQRQDQNMADTITMKRKYCKLLYFRLLTKQSCMQKVVLTIRLETQV